MRRLPAQRPLVVAIRALHRPLGVALLLAVTAGMAPSLATGAETAGPAAAATASERVTVARDNLWTLARKVQRDPTLSRQQVMVAILRANPGAFEDGNMHRLRRGVTLTIPPMAAAAREDRTAAARLVEEHRAQIGSSESATGLVPATEAPTPAPTASTPPAASPADTASGTGMNGRATEIAPPPAPPSAPVAAAPTSAASASGRVIDDIPASSPSVPWWPIAAGLVLASGLAVWIWRRPRREVVEPDTPSSTFLDEDGIPRRRRPKVTEVSEAAAEMARTVEALQQTQMLVRRGDEDTPSLTNHAMDAESHAGVQLELARALIAIGRQDAARLHLGSVLRQGSATQKLDAQALAAQIG